MSKAPKPAPALEVQTGEDEPYEPTLGDLLGIPPLPTEDVQSTVTMSDDPTDLPDAFKPIPSAGPNAQDYAFDKVDQYRDNFVPPPDAKPVRPEPEYILPSDIANTRWESRIQIQEAFQYKGSFDGAPAWVDRNWLAWGEFDPLRGIDPGPALRVPMPGVITNDDSSGWVFCRIGDFICRQEVHFDDGRPPHAKVEVWSQQDFLRNFMPAQPKAPRRKSA